MPRRNSLFHSNFCFALLLVGSLVAPARLSHAQVQTAVAAPFTMEWTEGRCRLCWVARQLGALRFTRPNEAWAVGFWAPHSADAAGRYTDSSDGYVIVHTVDAGKIWKELPSSGTHTAEPAFSFVDDLHGWVSGMSPVGDSWVRRTTDRGRHWIQVSDEDLQAAVFVDEAHGFGKAGNHFLRSSDGGQTWNESVLSQMAFIDRMFFLNQNTGWVAGSSGEDAVILRTADGGQHWEESRIHTGRKTAEVRDVYFLNARQGWLITGHFNDEGTYLFRTQDGGATWKADPDKGFQGARNWLAGVRVIGNSLAFAYGRDDGGGSKDQGMLVYSHDGGDHWQKFLLPRRIYDCQAVEGNLECSALSGDTGLWLLKVRPSLLNGK